MTLNLFLEHTSIVGLLTIFALLACSVYVVALGRELSLRLAGSRLQGAWLLAQLHHLQWGQKLPPTRLTEYLARHNHPLSRLLGELVCLQTPVNLERGDYLLSTGLERERGRLERGLSGLGTVAVIAPFVGLFGTVAGITKTFADVAKLGKAGIEVVSAGVSEALVATGIGLIVAIVSVVLFNSFKARFDRAVADWDVTARTYLSLLACSPEEAEALWQSQPLGEHPPDDARAFLTSAGQVN